ncbi:MAG TPA: 5'/3'-nucleotidase SurE [Opitutaceae bacterium]
MNILLTNDDGFFSAGFLAAFQALQRFGIVQVVAPKVECSACSHKITLRSPITVEHLTHQVFGDIHAVEGTPADCVRLALSTLLGSGVDLVVSGINHGANAGVDMFYSGTVAGAREAAILGKPAIALSQALRSGVETNWQRTSDMTAVVIEQILEEQLPGPGFWSINFPAPIPDDAHERIHRVPVAVHPMPMTFDKFEQQDGRVSKYGYGASYWVREDAGPSDYTTIRDGGIAVSAIPLYGRF